MSSSSSLPSDDLRDRLPFGQMLEQLNDGVLVVDMSGEVIYLNAQMSRILQYEREELIGRTLFSLMSEDWARRAKSNLARRAQGVEERFDHQFLRKDGSPVWTMVSTRPMRLHDGQMISLVAIRDITERIEAEEALRAMRDELERRVEERTKALQHEISTRRDAERLAMEASAAKSRFLASMSHELRTPLNAIIGYTEMLLEEGQDIDESALMDDLERIRQAGHHLLSLVSDVLDLSKIEEGHMELVLEAFSPGELIADVADLAEALVRDHGTVLRVDDRFEGSVYLDKLKLKQILLNLVANAAKYTEQGTITISASGDASALHIEVRDTGAGIPPEALEHLFQPYTQAHDDNERHVGTGLGLAICRHYTDMMGGTILADSVEGQGSTFTLRLPTSLRISPHPLPHEDPHGDQDDDQR